MSLLLLLCSVVLIKRKQQKTTEEQENSKTVDDDEITLVPWIDLTKLSAVVNNNNDSNNSNEEAFREEDESLRQKLLLQPNFSSNASYSAGKEAVINWLSKHQLDVKAHEDAIVVQGGLVTLQPPYLAENCQATNVIVLDRVIAILARMPRSSSN
jgi:hypothetical protein